MGEVLFNGADAAFDEVRLDRFVVGEGILVIMTDIVCLECNHEVTDDVCVCVCSKRCR